MSVIIYKQRHKSPNLKKTAELNRAHINYISTRPRVMKNQNMAHGLFGKLDIGAIKEFENLDEIKKLVFKNSQKGTILFRAVISMKDETKGELNLDDNNDWQRFAERNMHTIAEKNNIDVNHLSWVAAMHQELGHPHLHIAFWDNSEKIRNSFVSNKIPNAIRTELIRNNFKNKILDYMKAKDESVTSIREITSEMVTEFENALNVIDKKQYRKLMKNPNKNIHFDLGDDKINELFNHVMNVKSVLPKKGRISYQFLDEKAKQTVDEAVKYILDTDDTIKYFAAEYVDSKINVAELYGNADDKKEDYEKEVDKIIANKVIAMVRYANKLDQESFADYSAYDLYYSILNAFTTGNSDSPLSDNNLKYKKELSTDAKKELAKKKEDKGYER